MSNSPAPKRLLIVQLADIGDLVLSTPALAALREAHPDAHITVLTTAHAAPILAHTNLADEILLFDKHTFDSAKALLKPPNFWRAVQLAWRLRQGHYDTALVFHHFSTRFGALKFAALVWSAGCRRILGLENGNGFFLTERLPDEGFGARHQAQYWLDLAGLTGAATTPRPAVIGMSEDDRQWAAGALADVARSGAPLIAVHAGSGGYSHARRWDAAHFAEVADTLAQGHKAQIVLVGGKNDDSGAVKAAMHAPAHDLSGQTTLAQLAAVLEQCDLFVGADSGVVHIATAAGCDVVAIFGPSNHLAWAPWTPNGHHRIVRSAPECSPCSYVETIVGLREGCPARTCMRMVTTEHVIAAADDILNGSETDSPPPPIIPHTQRANRLKMLGIPVDAITYAEWFELIDAWVHDTADTRCRHVCTVNPEFIMIAQDDVNFRNILRRADLCIPDGVGLLWAARQQGTPLPERVTGSDGVPRIAQVAAERGWRIFLLGAAPGVADKAAEILRSRSPGVQIVGTYSGSPAPEEEDALVAMVNASGADILFVAYGAPEQDKWIARNLPRLKPRMAMGVGGSLDFIAGVLPRAPMWMQRAGLEWLYRLYLQPRRIGRMMRLPRFVMATLRENRAIKR
ncbi:MAG: WecB/TagA/CpsF family glycosyltransferase [Anaerolineae bacterium]|nr:WecB/TagA/CpsF family glycosyltransferase [Anaerolineae bacterium]